MKSRRRVVVIANWRDRKHPEAGGAEVVCERVASSFVEYGLEVVLLTASVAGEPHRETVAGYRIIRRGSRFTVYPWALLWIVLHRGQIRGVLDSQNGIPFFSPLAVGRKTPVLMLLHHIHQDQFPLYFSPLMSSVGQRLERTGSRLVYRDRTIVAVSPSTRKRARRELGLEGDIVVVPPGSEANVSTVSEIRGRAYHPRIVCVGRLAVHKATASIVEAVPSLLAEFPHLELHLVGDGSERPTLEALVERLGVGEHVVLHGSVSAPERDHLMRTAWMSVNASEGEGWGLSIIEANSLGVPVLAFRRPGLKDSIRHGETGWLIDEGHSLASAIGGALREMADGQAAEAMAARTREWSSQFTWDEMASQILSLMEAEEGRLAQSPNNRRLLTDLAIVARIPTELLPDELVPRFRGTDKCMLSEGDLVVLLRNTDTKAAHLALRRSGLAPSVIENERVRIAVARPVDFVSPAVCASPALSAARAHHEDALAG